MNYTEKYHLPQWEEEDRIMRTDFNQAMSTIDSNLAAAKNEARTAATKAETALANKNYVIGTYNGSSTAQDIVLGFQPSAVIISAVYSNSDQAKSAGMISLHVSTLSYYSHFEWIENGFRVDSDPLRNYPCMNWPSHLYIYIAFR